MLKPVRGRQPNADTRALETAIAILSHSQLIVLPGKASPDCINPAQTCPHPGLPNHEDAQLRHAGTGAACRINKQWKSASYMAVLIFSFTLCASFSIRQPSEVGPVSAKPGSCCHLGIQFRHQLKQLVACSKPSTCASRRSKAQPLLPADWIAGAIVLAAESGSLTHGVGRVRWTILHCPVPAAPISARRKAPPAAPAATPSAVPELNLRAEACANLGCNSCHRKLLFRGIHSSSSL